jgi:hypothetical protein
MFPSVLIVLVVLMGFEGETVSVRSSKLRPMFSGI